MRNCPTCGEIIEINQTVCLKCGCSCAKNVSVSFNRKKAYTGWMCAMDITISNDKTRKKLSLSNGESKSIDIPTGNYTVDISFGGLKNKFEISLTRNTNFQPYIKMGFIKNTLLMTEI